MPQKLTIDEVDKIIKSKGGKLLSTEYNSVHQDLLIKIGNSVETRKLVNIRKTKTLKPKSEQIKSLSDKQRQNCLDKIRKTLKRNNVLLISNTYINDITPIKIKFPNGETNERTWASIKGSIQKLGKLLPQSESRSLRGSKPTLHEIKEDVEARGGKLLSTEYNGWDAPLLVETVDGVREKKKISYIRKQQKLYSKEYCSQKRRRNQRLPYSVVKELVESKGGELLSKEEEYEGVHKPITIKTQDGCIETRLLSNIQKLKTLLSKSSDFEMEITDFVEECGLNVVKSDRTLIAPQELDIVIPDKKLAIECNGLFWHCDLYKHKNYHLKKTKAVNERGYSLIHVSEYDWEFKRDIIKSLISIRLGKAKETVAARKCKVVELTSNESKNFLESNHLQGNTFQGNIRYGLKHNDELVSVMTFSKPRFSKNRDFELCRFANKKETIVNGAFPKLMTHFKENNFFNSVISYCDIAVFDGSIYENNGFKHVNRSEPNYKYFKPKERILESRNKYQKHKLKDKLGVFDESLSEYQNMINNGYLRIWDCGNDVYVYDNR